MTHKRAVPDNSKRKWNKYKFNDTSKNIMQVTQAGIWLIPCLYSCEHSRFQETRPGLTYRRLVIYFSLLSWALKQSTKYLNVNDLTSLLSSKFTNACKISLVNTNEHRMNNLLHLKCKNCSLCRICCGIFKSLMHDDFMTVIARDSHKIWLTYYASQLLSTEVLIINPNGWMWPPNSTQ